MGHTKREVRRLVKIAVRAREKAIQEALLDLLFKAVPMAQYFGSGKYTGLNEACLAAGISPTRIARVVKDALR